jgi:hypothetical protein
LTGPRAGKEIEMEEKQKAIGSESNDELGGGLFIGDYFTHMRSGIRFVVVGIHHTRNGFTIQNRVEIEVSPEDEAERPS